MICVNTIKCIVKLLHFVAVLPFYVLIRNGHIIMGKSLDVIRHASNDGDLRFR